MGEGEERVVMRPDCNILECQFSYLFFHFHLTPTQTCILLELVRMAEIVWRNASLWNSYFVEKFSIRRV
jgi:hypothetical protein